MWYALFSFSSSDRQLLIVGKFGDPDSPLQFDGLYIPAHRSRTSLSRLPGRAAACYISKQHAEMTAIQRHDS
jgi:hypothetical protein